MRELKQNYHINNDTRVLGSGQYGRVFHTCSTKDPNFQVAIKVLDKHKLVDQLDQLMEEVAILNKLDHPNIVKVIESFENKSSIFIVMELFSGVELFEYISNLE